MRGLSLKPRVRLGLLIALGVAAIFLVCAPQRADTQGLVEGVERGAREGNKAVPVVGGVLGGAIGGVVGVVTGVTDAFTGHGRQAAAPPPDKGRTARTQKAANAKMAKATPDKSVTVLTQDGEPQLTAVQIVSNSDAYVERIKKELNLSDDQEKNWAPFASAMHYLGHNGADRLNLRTARAKRDPPDDIIEQMRNEAQFLVDRAADQRNVADAADPLFASLDDKQKQMFIDEMVRLSHERGLD